MKFRQNIRKHRNRGKHIFEDSWGFKKSFKKDYYDRRQFKKEEHIYYR